MTIHSNPTTPIKPQFAFDELRESGCGVSNRRELEQHLADWARGRPQASDENRVAASQRIAHAWQHLDHALDLSNLNLTSLPAVIGDMLALRQLDLSGNCLAEKPAVLGKLGRLHDLNLSDNPLVLLGAQSLPPNLQHLNLDRTALTAFPHSLVRRSADGLHVLFRKTLADSPALARAKARLEAHNAYDPEIFHTGSEILQHDFSSWFGGHAQAAANPLVRNQQEPRRRILWDSPTRPVLHPTRGPEAHGTQRPDSGNAAAPGLSRVAQALTATLARSRSTPITTNQAARGAAHEAASIPAGGQGIEAAAAIDLSQFLHPRHHSLSPELKAWAGRARSEESLYEHIRAAITIQNCVKRGDTSLNLSGLKLDSLPSVVWQQQQLTHLHLGGTQLGQVPENIGLLKNLTHLTLSENQLAAVPATLANLTELRVLDLSKNCFRAPPAELSQLRKLEYLYLTHNPIPSGVPHDLSALPEKCQALIGTPQQTTPTAPERHTFPGKPLGPVILVLR